MGEMMKRFFKGIPITDTPPYSHRRKLPTMPELTPDQEVILLTPEKDTFNFGVGSGRNLAREQKEMLEQMEINVTPADVNVLRMGTGNMIPHHTNGSSIWGQKMEHLCLSKTAYFQRGIR
ncbi:Hypothetical predicted protein [Mytilus galloprovincialis]|uniref:Uncharacterized protein n=1 Tax=Mytilus galloprovincialis TaxID=29158 RepID=A0A8B6BNN0_MYTGA|nr:Hypothetical predicted protein [Mytilus galloprovincialis]